MWQRVVATCPDDHLQHHMIQPRQLVRDKGIEFDRINSVTGHYGFYQGEDAVAVVIADKGELTIHYNPTTKQMTPEPGPDWFKLSTAPRR